jgi:large subunit ribosomal protein L14e
MFEIGRWCVKTAGRDGGLRCVVVEKVDDHFVIVDGETRRKKCNILHLEPLPKVSKLSNGSHEEVEHVFKEAGITLAKKKSKVKQDKPTKRKVVPEKVEEKAKPAPKKVKKKTA